MLLPRQLVNKQNKYWKMATDWPAGIIPYVECEFFTKELDKSSFHELGTLRLYKALLFLV